MNEEKSEFANALYKLGKVAILKFPELLEKEGITENTGKTIEDASAVIINLVSKALEPRPIKWVDINNDNVRFMYFGVTFRVTKELCVDEVKELCLHRTLAAILLELLLKKENINES